MAGRHHKGRHPKQTPQDAAPAAPAMVDNTATVPADQPRFAQPELTPIPTKYKVHHASDAQAYKILDAEARAHELRPIPFPAARGGDEPVLRLADIYGSGGAALEKRISDAGLLVFHSVGDTGSVKGPELQAAVTNKMITDFADAPPNQPSFFLHLGDVIYNFGEAAYYYDQFYDAYRNYPGPIVAIAGNHDGVVAPNTNAASLDAFLRNFCAPQFEHTPESGGLDRTAQIEPGVYYTFEAPMLRVLVLYSNALEDPGVLSSQDGAFPEISDIQLTFLRTALGRVKSDKFDGALIIAHHHPAYTLAGERGHGSSTDMRKQIDAICDEVGVWPHAILSAHAHNYQRYTRTRGKRQIPYVIAGGGGHSPPQKLTRLTDPPLRTPMQIPTDEDTVVLENYDQTDLGYLRILVTKTQLRIEYHPASDGFDSRTPDDFVTVDLASHRLVHYANP